MENIKRNYVGFTLLFTSVIVSFVDFRSAMVVNMLGIIAFVFTDKIVKFISEQEIKHLKDKDFYDARDQFQQHKDFYDAKDIYEKSFNDSKPKF